MTEIVAQLTTKVNSPLARGANDLVASDAYPVPMRPPPRKTRLRKETVQTRIFSGRQPRRPHFIREWAEKRGYKTQSELVEASGADKSLVSRWYDEDAPSSPGTDWQARLAALFGYPGDLELVFRHPDDDWMARFFRNRSDEEKERAKRMLEAAFPEKSQHHQ